MDLESQSTNDQSTDYNSIIMEIKVVTIIGFRQIKENGPIFGFWKPNDLY